MRLLRSFEPNGSVLIVDTLTSNVNRTVVNVRSAFGKKGGNMGASGSVSYLFDNKSVVEFAGDNLATFEKLYDTLEVAPKIYTNVDVLKGWRWNQLVFYLLELKNWKSAIFFDTIKE